MLSFDSRIYRKDAVQKACADYRELANIIYTEDGDRILCDIQSPQGDPELIADEFGNYILNLTVMMGGTEK